MSWARAIDQIQLHFAWLCTFTFTSSRCRAWSPATIEDWTLVRISKLSPVHETPTRSSSRAVLNSWLFPYWSYFCKKRSSFTGSFSLRRSKTEILHHRTKEFEAIQDTRSTLHKPQYITIPHLSPECSRQSLKSRILLGNQKRLYGEEGEGHANSESSSSFLATLD